MFGIGLSELILIAVAVFIFIGPQRLPGLMKQLARFYVQLKRASIDIKDGIDGVVRDAEAEIVRENLRKNLTGQDNHGLTGADINSQLHNQGNHEHSVPQQDPHPTSR